MNRARRVVIATVAITIVASLLSLLVPVPHSAKPSDFYFDLIVSLATTILYIGGAVAIVGGFDAFTSKLRRAYTIIFAGLILWAVGYFQLPLLVLFDLFNNDIVVSITVIPYVVSALLVFAGTRMLAKLFDVSSITIKWWFALLVVVVVTTVTVFVPHTPLAANQSEQGLDTINGLIMAVATLFSLGAYNILLIKKRASVTLTNALAWLSVSMGTVAILAAVGSTVASLIFPPDGQLTIIVALVPSCVAAAMFLRSGYSFGTITESSDVEGAMVARGFFGKPLHAQVHDTTTSLDIVMYTAGLASNPRAIDTQLETIRSLTADLQGDQKLGDQQEQTLLDTYTQIENYLLTKEPLRVFTKESLRQDVAQKLRLTADTPSTFWPRLV